MSVLILTLFASLMLVLAGVVFLVRLVRQGDIEHGDRLAFLPLAEDRRPEPEAAPEEETAAAAPEAGAPPAGAPGTPRRK